MYRNLVSFAVIIAIHISISTGHANSILSSETKLSSQAYWDNSKKLLIIKVNGLLDRPWQEVKETIDPINWSVCSKYFRGSYVTSSSPKEAIAGDTWKGNFKLVENIIRDMTEIPNANKWYLKWSDKRQIFAQSEFNINTELNRQSKSYIVNYSLTKNNNAFVKAFRNKTAVTVSIDGDMIRNDGYILVRKLDQSTSYIDVYKEIKFKSKYMQTELRKTGVDLLEPVLTDMVLDWVNCIK